MPLRESRQVRILRNRAKDVVLTLRALRPTRSRVDPQSAPTRSTLEVALSVLLQQQGSVAIVQVGANDGRTGDPLHSFVMAHANQTRCVLIEPQSQLIPMLTDAYAAHPDVTIVNKAVGPEAALTLYAVHPRAWPDLRVPYAKGWPIYRAPTGIASADRTRVRMWINRYYEGDLPSESLLEPIIVPSQSLPVILEEAGWGSTQVDLLQVDVEGFDDDVVYASDLPTRRPALVHFEHAHLPKERRAAVWEYLQQAGYECALLGRDTLAIRSRGD